mmetsp:Transcript_19016/g.26526  ORF Transcript_19016/g.26526 Transcript_19016/m.26526 type:complete len:393 (-) Transcript_19016:103-1281(-)
MAASMDAHEGKFYLAKYTGDRKFYPALVEKLRPYSADVVFSGFSDRVNVMLEDLKPIVARDTEAKDIEFEEFHPGMKCLAKYGNDWYLGNITKSYTVEWGKANRSLLVTFLNFEQYVERVPYDQILVWRREEMAWWRIMPLEPEIPPPSTRSRFSTHPHSPSPFEGMPRSLEEKVDWLIRKVNQLWSIVHGDTTNAEVKSIASASVHSRNGGALNGTAPGLGHKCFDRPHETPTESRDNYEADAKGYKPAYGPVRGTANGTVNGKNNGHVSKYDNLCEAVEAEDYEAVKSFLNSGSDPNERCKMTKSPALALAVEANSLPIVQFLLDRGADPWAKTHDGRWLGELTLSGSELESFINKIQPLEERQRRAELLGKSKRKSKRKSQLQNRGRRY